MDLKLRMFLTDAGSGDALSGEEPVNEIVFADDPDGTENEVVNLYPELSFDSFEGFGGAVTDSAAYVYSLLDETQKKRLMALYFSPEHMNYRFVRVPLDSCDFATEPYEAMSDPKDWALRSFSFERTERHILPMLQDISRTLGRPPELMLSPWSPPAFMKTNHARRHGGSLLEAYAPLWAEYLCRYIEEFRGRGFPVRRMSLQNEPKAVQEWDSCIYTPEQEKHFLEQHLYPALERHGLTDVEVFIWDHNKERVYERAAAIVSGPAEAMVTGVACHWYSGDHFEALDLVRRRYPRLKLIVSESCIEYSKYGVGDSFANAARLSHEIIGDLNHGVCAFYDWNLLLDERGGPTYVGNYCQAPFLYDTNTGQLMPQKLQRHLFHFAHFLRPGARRIGFSRYTDRLDMTAFRNPDGRIAVILLNRGGAALPVRLRMNGKLASFVVEPETICTCEITQ